MHTYSTVAVLLKMQDVEVEIKWLSHSFRAVKIRFESNC